MKKIVVHTTRLLALWLSLWLVACEDNNNPYSPDPDETAEEAYFSVDLETYTPPATRAEVEEIDPWEYRVNKVWILLYNKKDILEYKWVLHIQNYDSSTNQLRKFFNTGGEAIVEEESTVSGFRTVAHQIKRKEYKMAVLANPPAALFDALSIETDSPLSALTTALDGRQRELTTRMFGGYTDDPDAPFFFMSNANGLVSVTPSLLQASAGEASAKPLAVNLDRLLAKVSVKEKKGGVALYPNGVILDQTKPVNWYADVTNKSTYLIRQFARLANGNEENEANSPTGANRVQIYAEDPNFKLSENSNDQFNRWTTGQTIPYCTWISGNNSDPGRKTFYYVFENTLDVETQKHTNWSNFATRIVLEAYLIYPELLWDPNDPHNENDPNRNYYSCLLVNDKNETNWRIFTHQQAAHWLDRGFPYTEGATAENQWIKLLEEKIRDVQKDYDQQVPGAFNFRDPQLPGTSKELYHSYKQVTYHPLGLNKYNIPVRHFGTGSTPANPREQYGYYGIVRNNMYTVTINSITGPGTGIYDWDNRYISVEISITPWFKRKQEVDLIYE